MAIDYTSLLTAEQKQNILNQRIAQFAAEAWQHELNKQTCAQLNDEAGVASAEQALATLEAAINVHQAELNNIA
jgi:predicted metal-dependent HD superfamily phosphohydrolase